MTEIKIEIFKKDQTFSVYIDGKRYNVRDYNHIEINNVCVLYGEEAP